MACAPICSHLDANKGLGRPHFTCLTCLFRRWYYGKLDPDKFLLIPYRQKAVFQIRSLSPMGTPVPKKYMAYFMLMNMDHSVGYLRLRNSIVKVLMTVAEFLGQW